MNKYEIHNQKQLERFGEDSYSFLTIVNPALFDICQELAPEFLQNCIVAYYRFLPAKSVSNQPA